MRGNGHSWREVADEFVRQWGLTYLQAFRLAHGWSQEETAKHYNAQWHPQRPLTGKHISYWEMWPSKSGKEPPLTKLRMLADVYGRIGPSNGRWAEPSANEPALKSRRQ